MSRIFISGSSTGLGMMAAKRLVAQGHEIVLHARNDARAEDARRKLPQTKAVVVGDVETIAGTKDIAAQVNALGRFDAVIHNAAVGSIARAIASLPTACRTCSRSIRCQLTS